MLTEPSFCVAVQLVPGTSQSGQTATVSDTNTSDQPTTTGTVETSGQWTISDSSGASSASDSAQVSLGPIIISGLFVVLPQCFTQRCGLVQVGAGEHSLVIEAEDQGCLWTRSFLSLTAQ